MAQKHSKSRTALLMRAINEGADIRQLKLRVVDYARVSTVKPAQRASFQNQLVTYRTMIQQNPNWTYAGTYSDEGVTGTRMELRGGFRQMLADGQAGLFDLVLVKSISRFARNLKESLTAKDVLKAAGVMVFFDEGQLNTFKTADDRMFAFLALVADMESAAARDRTRIVLQQGIRQGKIYGNDKLLGYRKAGGVLTVEETEAAAVREIFRLYVEQGLGTRRIAAELQRKGLRRRNGAVIPPRTVAAVLANPKYKGWFCGGKTAALDLGCGRRTVLLAPEEWLQWPDKRVPTLVPAQMWDKAAALRASRARSAAGRMPRNPGRYRWSGKIHPEGSRRSYSHVTAQRDGTTVHAWQYRAGDTKPAPPLLYEAELDALCEAERVREILVLPHSTRSIIQLKVYFVDDTCRAVTLPRGKTGGKGN